MHTHVQKKKKKKKKKKKLVRTSTYPRLSAETKRPVTISNNCEYDLEIPSKKANIRRICAQVGLPLKNVRAERVACRGRAVEQAHSSVLTIETDVVPGPHVR